MFVAQTVFAYFVSLFLASIPDDLRQGLRDRALIGVGFFSLEVFWRQKSGILGTIKT
jgi:hypothetical protein